MQIKKIVVGCLETNCYLLIEDNNCLIIDPGDESEKIINEIGNLNPIGIIITHYHFDHIGALDEIKNYYDINIYDINNLRDGINNIFNFEFEVIHTKGHHNTCITIYFEKQKIMFTGDFLFKLSIGRTDFEESNEYEMFDSLNKIKKYPDDIKIYPGHGEDSNLGYEKQYNMFLK